MYDVVTPLPGGCDVAADGSLDAQLADLGKELHTINLQTHNYKQKKSLVAHNVFENI